MQSEWRPGKWQLSGEAQRPGKPCAEFHNCPGDNRLDSVSSRKVTWPDLSYGKVIPDCGEENGPDRDKLEMRRPRRRLWT